jgi:hypothetical protein
MTASYLPTWHDLLTNDEYADCLQLALFSLSSAENLAVQQLAQELVDRKIKGLGQGGALELLAALARLYAGKDSLT